MSRVMTEDQAAAIAAWQMITIEANAQWDVYCSFKRRSEGDVAYAEWQAIYRRQQDAMSELLRTFYPDEAVRNRRA